MVRNARFSWNDEDHFESPDRSNGFEELDDFDFDGFETARRKRHRPNSAHDVDPPRPDKRTPQSSQLTTDH